MKILKVKAIKLIGFESYKLSILREINFEGKNIGLIEKSRFKKRTNIV